MFSISLSRVGIQLGARWQFWKKTQWPLSMASCIILSAQGPWITQMTAFLIGLIIIGEAGLINNILTVGLSASAYSWKVLDTQLKDRNWEGGYKKPDTSQDHVIASNVMLMSIERLKCAARRMLPARFKVFGHWVCIYHSSFLSSFMAPRVHCPGMVINSENN